MLLRNQIRKHPRAPIPVGLMFTALGAVSLRFLHPGPHLSQGLADGLTGLCYGLGIGSLVVGLAATRRWGRGADDAPQA